MNEKHYGRPLDPWPNVAAPVQQDSNVQIPGLELGKIIQQQAERIEFLESALREVKSSLEMHVRLDSLGNSEIMGTLWSEWGNVASGQIEPAPNLLKWLQEEEAK